MSVAIQSRPPPRPTPTQKMPAPRLQARPPPPVVAAKQEPVSTPSTPTSSSSSTVRPRSTTITAPAAFAVAGKDVSSSTGKIFAKPSKEWVLPERAKPGRKASTQEPESKRQSQNRLSQRAHRARRTDYIQTLEERLRKYEADEIHSNVRLQEVARALKSDNDKLKAEVMQLRNAITAARKDRETWATERRSLSDTIRTLRTQISQLDTAHTHNHNNHNHNHSRHSTAPSPHLEDRIEYELAALTRSPVLTPLQETTRTNKQALACPICPDPDPDCPCQQEPEAPPTDLNSTLAPANSFPVKCGMCELVPEACLCEEDVKPVISPQQSLPSPVDNTDCGLCTNDSFCACRAGAASSSISSDSVQTTSHTATTTPSTAPTAQVAAPAVPLRLRARPAARQSIWALSNVPNGTSRAEAVCTGDPANCDACRDDSFGREFCGHLFGKKCEGCATGKCGGKGPNSVLYPPSNSSVSSSGSSSNAIPLPRRTSSTSTVPSISSSHTRRTSTDETLRPDEAWKQLKAHPNAAFTPLAVLADVVARRAKVDGPRVELSPPPESRKRLAVESSAVREALRYLDEHDGERKRRRVGQ